MNFAQLRDALLALAPHDKAHVVAVNRAEAAFWEASQGGLERHHGKARTN